MLAVDFFTVETLSLQRLYVLFFIALGSRRIHLASCITNPSDAWVTQQARQFAWTVRERQSSFRFLIRDCHNKFSVTSTPSSPVSASRSSRHRDERRRRMSSPA